MTTAKRLMTADDLLALSGDGRRYELLDGVLVELAPTNRYHGRVEVNIAFELTTFVRAGAGGEVLVGEPGFYLERNPDRVRAPDVCYFTPERVPPPEAGARGYLDVLPDLAVEVISPGDSAGEVEQKVAEWLEAGVRMVWVVYPATRRVMVYRSLTDIRAYSETEVLDGAPVLPGFACPVAALFV